VLNLFLSLALAQTVSGSTPTGEVTEATVFLDRATVTRQVDVFLEAGETEVLFSDLPANLDITTMQANGTGNAVIRGLSIDRVELAADRRTRVDALNQLIAAKGDVRQERMDDKAAAEAELSFLRSLGAAGAGQLSAELLFSPDTASDADAMAGLLRRRVRDGLQAVHEAAMGMRQVDTELAALRRELSTVQGAAQWARHEVSVLLEAPSSGPSSVTLTYTVPGASWTPLWDARADVGADSLAMTLSASVVQTTGEDWSGAALTLSTARPAGGVMAPELSPFWLHNGYANTGKVQRSQPAPAMEMFDDYMEEEDEAAYAPEPAPMLIQQAQVIEQIIASQFDVPGGTSISGDGTARKVQVIGVDVHVEWMHIAVPSLDERAWMVAEGTWPEMWSLTAGSVSIFASDSYVGSMRLPTVGTGATFELGFGPDDAVTVERTVTEDLRRSPGLFRRPRVTRTWQTTLRNRRSDSVTLSLRDRIPVSTQSKWRVDALLEEPTERLPEGLMVWEMPLSGGAEAVVNTGWRVTYPKKFIPGGL
jgi:uncharacterized protein (TIGR02231 family)